MIKNKSIIQMSSGETRKFFLKGESYSNLDLPIYFSFEEVLEKINVLLDGKKLSDFSDIKKCKELEKVNYTIIANKDGKYSWRPLQLIHPAIYVSLVHALTEDTHWHFLIAKFKEFEKIKNIECFSLPLKNIMKGKDKAVQILNWWGNVEQNSIELSIEYDHVFHSDIADCYSSIYTHSVAWALHGKEVGKTSQENKGLLGNVIDRHLQNMAQGQTNGIPQGSVLMDFIAELVLGYVDQGLSEKIKEEGISNYTILRYRDDYRIFVNNFNDGNIILKLLSEVLLDLGLKLNTSKTLASSQIIEASIKPDKLEWMRKSVPLINSTKKNEAIIDIQKYVLLIYLHSQNYPNSGSLTKALTHCYDHIKKSNSRKPKVIISIVVDIAYRNPKTYPIISAILSKLISFLDEEEERKKVVEKIFSKLSTVPNTEYMQIWIQRILLGYKIELDLEGDLCLAASGAYTSLWNNEWINNRDLKKILTQTITSQEKISSLPQEIGRSEIELFSSPYP